MSEWKECKGIKDRPDNSRCVLATDGKSVDKAYWNYDSWRGCAFNEEITHYMELPEPPKKKHYCENEHCKCESIGKTLLLRSKRTLMGGDRVSFCPLCGESAEGEKA